MISDHLLTGEENATPGRELAKRLNVNIRDVAQAVERERRAGIPICASSGLKRGYYIAANDEELTRYCNRLHHRAAELYKTRHELLKTLKKV